MNFDELKLIFLLHDLGMFYQRTGLSPSNTYKDLSIDDLRYAHSKWSASLAKEMGLSKDIQEVILYHHKPEALEDESYAIAKILSKASEHFVDKEAPGALSLLSVFSRVQITGKVPKSYFTPVQKLDIDNFKFPDKEDTNNNKEVYERLWNDFKNELEKSGSERLPENLYYLIKKYTLLIPSALQDISLFDHIKITTAIATCLYKYLEGKPPQMLDEDDKFFKVISGGISGIQRFIYDVASPQAAQEGMAKRLRGRSFYLSLFNDAVATSILERLGLPEANLIWCGGGNFLILAPNTDKVSKELDEIRKEIHLSLMKKFNSSLFLDFAARDTKPGELKEFGKLMESIDAELAGIKRQKFIDSLDYLFAEEKEFSRKTCPVCDNIMPADREVCSDCDDHKKLGQKLAHATYYLKVIAKKESDEFDVFLSGIGYKIIRSKEEITENIRSIADDSKKIQVFKLNDTEFIDEGLITQCSELNLPVSFGFSFIASTVPKYYETVLSFTNLAELSKGANKVGILKMDVDNLGKIFASGFASEEGNIARISTMSSMLDFYFSGILNKICGGYYFLDKVCDECKNAGKEVEITLEEETETRLKVYRIDNKEKVCKECLKNKIPAVYVNYAGGDDLLIIGPWDYTIELAKDIRQKFKEFTCNNADISISGGVFISGQKFPIGRAASLAGEVLKKSKDAGKNSMSAFGETVCWDSNELKKGFNDLFDFSVELEEYVDGENKKVSKSFVYSLLRMWQSSFGQGKELNDKIRIERKSYIPLLKYKLARTVKDKKLREDLDKKIQKMFPWIRIPVSWVSLRTR